MLSIRRHLTRAISFGILLSTSFADTVTLKNGEKVEGKVITETDEQVVVEVKVSASITDERVIPRAEVEKIDKISPETLAYKSIQVVQIGANSFTVPQYEASIRTLEAYIKQFPLGTHTKDVQATLDEFLAEKKRVDGGEVKLRGAWLSRAEVEREKVQIGGSLALEQMKNQAAAGDSIAALNTFSAVEKPYGGSSSMPEMIELARQLVGALKPAVERAIPDQKVLKAQKEQGFQNAKAEDRTGMVEAYKAEMAQAEALATNAEKAGQWPPLMATSEKALTVLLGKVNKEAPRLAALPVDKMKKSVQLTNTAKQALSTGDIDGAVVTLKEATTLWPTNEMAVRLNKEALAAQKAAAPAEGTNAAPPASETPKPKPATPRPSAALPPASAPVAKAVEDEKPIYLQLPVVIGVVVAIAAALAGINIYKKTKAPKAEDTIE